VDRQRLDRVALRRLQVVEAVEEDGRRAPARRLEAQGVERGLVVQDAITAVDRAQPVAIGAVQPGELLGVGGARGLALAPRPHGGPPAPGLDALLLELGDEAQQGLDEARRRGRRRESARPPIPARRAISRIRPEKATTRTPKTAPAPASSRR
jgi:hypothetical protein